MNIFLAAPFENLFKDINYKYESASLYSKKSKYN